MSTVYEDAQAQEALVRAHQALQQVKRRFWEIKDDPRVPYDEVYQLHRGFDAASLALARAESRLLSRTVVPAPEDLAELQRIETQLQQDRETREMIEGLVALADLLAKVV